MSLNSFFENSSSVNVRSLGFLEDDLAVDVDWWETETDCKKDNTTDLFSSMEDICESLVPSVFKDFRIRGGARREACARCLAYER